MSSSSPVPAIGPDPTTAEIERANSVLISAIVLTSASAVAVALRFYVRGKLLRSVKSEDWWMLVSMVGSPPPLPASLKVSGVGKGMRS